MVKTRLIYALTIFAATTLTTLLSSALTGTAYAQRVELLDFYLPTCAPCKAMAPVIDQLAREGVAVRKVDGSREAGLAQQMRVEGYPTFVAVVEGREIGRIVGATNYANLQEMLTTAQRMAASSAPTSTGSPSTPSSTQSAFAQPGASQSGGPQTFGSAIAEKSFSVGADRGAGLAVAGNSPAQPIAVQQPAQGNLQLVDSLISSSVRIVIDESGSRSFGTGTIIDSRQGEALVATCAHLFKDMQGNILPTEGNVTLELFESNGAAPRVIERVAGRLVSYNLEADVALVSLRPTVPVKAVPIISSPASIVAGAAVQSVGCDLGADPSHRSSQVVSLNRYNGAPNIETTGAPIQGRSGGGLFNAAGELIGICFAADEELDEGLYAGIASVYAELDRVGMSELYRASPIANPAAKPDVNMQTPIGMASADMASKGRSSLASNPFAESPSRLEPVMTQNQLAGSNATVRQAAWPDPVIRGQSISESQLSPVERATLDEVVRRGAKSEVVLLIRPTDATGRTEVLTLDSASPEFVATLRRMGNAGSLPRSN